MKKLVAVLACAMSLSAFAADPHAGMTTEAAVDAGTKPEKSMAKKAEKKTKATTETTAEGESATKTETSTSTTTKPKAH